MTPAEHYKEAEHLLKQVSDLMEILQNDEDPLTKYMKVAHNGDLIAAQALTMFINQAQVHATLATVKQ